MTDWFCYLLMSLDDNCTYIGSTNNPEKRLSAHNCGRGAKYTRGRTWVPILIVGAFNDKKSCLSFESGWKKLSKKRKNDRLYDINILINKSFSYSGDAKWNRIMDLLYFVHNFTYIGTKFKLNHQMKLPFNCPEELRIKIFMENWIHDLPWPYFIRFY